MRLLNRKRRQSGFSLVELLIAMAVGAIGLTATIGLFMLAMSNNSRSKRDTAATLLSQTVLEQILLAGTNTIAIIPMTDCLGNNFNINTTGAAGGVGATLNANGDIVFAGNPPAGYQMNYTICRANGQTMTYDVRWNIRNLEVSGPTVYTRLVRVSAQPIGTQEARSFAVPITLRGMAAVAEN